MPAIPPIRRPVSIVVLSDFTCPWNYVGFTSLANVLSSDTVQALPLKINVQYRPYKLACPSQEAARVTIKEWLQAKSKGQYDVMAKAMAAICEKHGLTMYVS